MNPIRPLAATNWNPSVGSSFLLSIPMVLRRLGLIAWVFGAQFQGIQLLGNQSPKTLVVREHGRNVRYEIAENELYVRGADGRGRFELFGSKQLSDQRRSASLHAVATESFSPVAYIHGQTQIPEQRRVVTPNLWVKVVPGTDVSKLLEAVPGVQNLGEKTWAPGCYHFRATAAADLFQSVELLRAQSGVVSVLPQLGREYSKDLVPNDPLFPTQWHLKSTVSNGGTAGVDIDVLKVWDQFRGEGQIIGILDDAIQVDHPDLAAGIDLELAYDFRDGDLDPSPGDLAEDLHGTGVSGFAAARGNNEVGVTGVAFGAQLAPMRLIGGADLTDETIGEAFSRRNDVISIKNNSWGSRTTDVLDYPAEPVELAIEDAIKNGRGGRGEIFVFSAGNYGNLGDNLNHNMLKSRPDVIPVGAIVEDGSPAQYTTPGASLLVVAPGGQAGALSMHTTDLVGSFGQNAGGTDGDLADPNYTANFSGTSASAPIVSGVIALMLQANPELGWRDVQEILIRSAKKVRPLDSDWAANSAGYKFHPFLGAGLVQAGGAVELAKGWKRLGSQRSQIKVARDLRLSIPDDATKSLQQVFVFDGPPMRVEHVRVTVDITHLNRGQLQIELQSPGGMRSRLAERHTDRNDDWEFWTFGSRRHWAETSSGTWTLEIRDMVARLGGRLNYARVELLGTLLGGAEFVEAQWNEAPGLGTADGIISPGETIEEHVTLRNVDSTDLEGVRVEWFETSQTGVVEMLNSSVELGKVPAGQLATNGIPLSYRVAKLKALCGQTLEFACVSTANGVRATNRIFRRIGIVPGEAKTEEFVATVGLPLAVIDRGTVMATNYVDTVEGLIDDVRVWVRMDHPTVGDTQMSLIHPDGTEILLAQNRGGNNPDMGVGNCVGGTPLQFSDSAAMSIRKGEAPFAGSFQPDEPLATFRGKLAAGDWRLRISDVYDEDSGVLRCWGLTITSRPLLTSCEIFSMPSGVEILGFSPTVEGGFRIIGKTPNVGRVLLEASTDLVTWEGVAEATPSDVPFEMIDPNAGGAGGRFYRLRVP